MNEKKSGFYLSNGAYTLFKWLTQIVFPAVGSLYFGLAKIWGLAHAEDVVGTLALFSTFFGIIMGVSSRNYYKDDANYIGDLIVTKSPDGKRTLYSLEAGEHLDDIENRKTVSFKVTKPTDQKVAPVD